MPLHVGDGVEQLADAAVREHLALQRDEHLVGGGQRVEREHAQRRRAVEQDHVVGVARPRPARVRSTYSRPGRVSSCASVPASSMVAGSRSTPSSVGWMAIARRTRPSSTSWTRQLDGLGVEPERERQAGLRVEVDEEHLRPCSASAAPSEATVVVLATPPFWLATAMVRVTAPLCPGVRRAVTPPVFCAG